MRFDHYIPTRILFGSGALSELHKQALPGKKALIVTGAGQSVKKYGYLKQLTDQLDMSGVSYVLFDRILPNPIIEHVHEGAQVARAAGCDFVIGLGGGSTMDSYKAIVVNVRANPAASGITLDGGSGKVCASAQRPAAVWRSPSRRAPAPRGPLEEDHQRRGENRFGYDKDVPVLSGFGFL